MTCFDERDRAPCTERHGTWEGQSIGAKIASVHWEEIMPAPRNMPAPQNMASEISQENRQDHPVVQHLQREVANAFVLYANYKHYHWQTFGPLLRDLHLMFDEFAKETLATIDDMAERIRMIGQDVQAVQLKQFQQAASIQSAQASQSIREM